MYMIGLYGIVKDSCIFMNNIMNLESNNFV